MLSSSNGPRLRPVRKANPLRRPRRNASVSLRFSMLIRAMRMTIDPNPVSKPP